MTSPLTDLRDRTLDSLRVFVTVDIAMDAAEGRTIKLGLPSLPERAGATQTMAPRQPDPAPAVQP